MIQVNRFRQLTVCIAAMLAMLTSASLTIASTSDVTPDQATQATTDDGHGQAASHGQSHAHAAMPAAADHCPNEIKLPIRNLSFNNPF